MLFIKPVYAQVDFANPTINPIARYSTIGSFTNLFVPLMMIVAGFATLSMLLYGAYMFLTSEGNADKLKKAQSTLLYAVLGLLLVVMAFVITKIIGFLFKVQMPL